MLLRVLFKLGNEPSDHKTVFVVMGLFYWSAFGVSRETKWWVGDGLVDYWIIECIEWIEWGIGPQNGSDGWMGPAGGWIGLLYAEELGGGVEREGE